MTKLSRTYSADRFKARTDKSSHLVPELEELFRGADLGHRALRDLLFEPGEEGAERGAVSDVASDESGDFVLVLDGLGDGDGGDFADGLR